MGNWQSQPCEQANILILKIHNAIWRLGVIINRLNKVRKGMIRRQMDFKILET